MGVFAATVPSSTFASATQMAEHVKHVSQPRTVRTGLTERPQNAVGLPPLSITHTTAKFSLG